jgi:hypothetical protein
MKTLALLLVTVLAILSLAVIAFDAFTLARARLRRRRRERSGTYGVVVDSRGRVLGTYLDPFAHGREGARVHRGDSPWITPGLDEESGWAWEGFGATEEEARLAAERLRRRYVQLLPWLADELEDEEWRG